MGDKLTDAIADLQKKHNFANLQEEYNYVNEVNKAISDLEGSGGGGGDFDPTKYYSIIETDDKFITKANGTNAIADLAPKTGLYQTSGGTPVDLETQCQSLETRVADSVTNSALATALDTSTTFTAKDPSDGNAVKALDIILANIYVTPVSRQATLSAEQMKQIEGNILAELLKKMAK